MCVCFPLRLNADTANTHQALGECRVTGSEGLKVEAKQQSSVKKNLITINSTMLIFYFNGTSKYFHLI